MRKKATINNNENDHDDEGTIIMWTDALKAGEDA
jgi:hypothetical protein